jgi:hypothetical protein
MDANKTFTLDKYITEEEKLISYVNRIQSLMPGKKFDIFAVNFWSDLENALISSNPAVAKRLTELDEQIEEFSAKLHQTETAFGEEYLKLNKLIKEVCKPGYVSRLVLDQVREEYDFVKSVLNDDQFTELVEKTCSPDGRFSISPLYLMFFDILERNSDDKIVQSAREGWQEIAYKYFGLMKRYEEREDLIKARDKIVNNNNSIELKEERKIYNKQIWAFTSEKRNLLRSDLLSGPELLSNPARINYKNRIGHRLACQIFIKYSCEQLKDKRCLSPELEEDFLHSNSVLYDWELSKSGKVKLAQRKVEIISNILSRVDIEEIDKVSKKIDLFTICHYYGPGCSPNDQRTGAFSAGHLGILPAAEEYAKLFYFEKGDMSSILDPHDIAHAALTDYSFSL